MSMMRTSLTAAILAFLSSIAIAAPHGHRGRGNWTTQEWDVIVVGAGPAGIVIADRLSESGKSTLLLEGGGKSYSIVGGTERPVWLNTTDSSRVDVPGLYKSVFSNPGDLICGAFVNAYGGCTIGGSSAINAGLYFQPPASDWDDFHPEGWKSNVMQDAAEKIYGRQPSVTQYSQDGQYYLQSGYQAAKEWLVDGAGYSDITINDDSDLKYAVFGHSSFDYNNGQRAGPVTTYLQSALSRRNSQLRSGVRVKRVVRSGPQATGVIASINGSDTTIRLSKCGRVILSAGAIQSPQILMYSAIGDSETLKRLFQGAILGEEMTPSDWINNTAVGDGLFDNPNTFIELSSDTIESYTYSYDNPISSDAALYLNNRSGPYSFASETSVFWSFINHTDDGTPPSSFQGTIDSSGFSAFNSNDTITLNVYGTSGLLSSGKVILDSNFVPGPSSDVHYSNPRDASDIAQFIYSIFSHLPASLQPLNIPRNITFPDLVTYISTPSAYTVGSVNHWSSSCRLGSCVHAENVTVIGTRNIYVVDSSIIMPLTVNPMFGVMQAAERSAELILGMESGGRSHTNGGFRD